MYLVMAIQTAAQRAARGGQKLPRPVPIIVNPRKTRERPPKIFGAPRQFDVTVSVRSSFSKDVVRRWSKIAI